MEKLCSLQDISPPTQVYKNTIKSKIVSTVNATSAIAKLAIQHVKEDSRCRFSLLQSQSTNEFPTIDARKIRK